MHENTYNKKQIFVREFLQIPTRGKVMNIIQCNHDVTHKGIGPRIVYRKEPCQ